jgi:NDP-sugar pyrophosphorylase family protein
MEKKATATLALSGKYPVPVGAARLKDDRIVEFIEKPDFGRPISIGTLALIGEAFAERHPDRKSNLDLMGDLIHRLVANGKPVYGYLTDAFWSDVGSIEKYEKISSELLEEELGFLFRS